jgi:short-subunit dehydrogenase
MGTALVTGATSGIGAAFAERLAADGHDLVLVARDAERLKTTADRLSGAHQVAVDVLVADLADRAALAGVEHRLRDADAPVDLLVNNAGIGSTGRFWETDPAVLTAQYEILTTAVFRLSRAALEEMVRRDRGAVINVASFAALAPGRNGAAYTAAKSFVLTLTQEVAGELTGTGVRVLACCPGWTRTELHTRSGSDSPSASSNWWLAPDAVVDRALSDLDRGRVVSVPGFRYRLIRTLRDLTPRQLGRAARRLAGKPV